MASKHISLPSSFAAGDPIEWFMWFEIRCNANEWSDVVKAWKLPTLLEGEAFAVCMELSEAEKESYQSAKAEMIARLAPVQCVLLGDFHGRWLHPGEPLSVFLHVLKPRAASESLAARVASKLEEGTSHFTGPGEL